MAVSMLFLCVCLSILKLRNSLQDVVYKMGAVSFSTMGNCFFLIVCYILWSCLRNRTTLRFDFLHWSVRKPMLF